MPENGLMITLPRLKKNSVIVIGGPTASGKSGLAVDIAKTYGGEVVNADSMQVYRGLPVLSAVPSAEERQGIPHHLYEIYEPFVNGTVVDWLAAATAEIRDIWQRGCVPVVVGGTGMYLDNLINGTTPIPEPDEKIRQQILSLQRQMNAEEFYQKLQEVDAAGAALLKPNDTTRVRRAYEIFVQTGMSVAEWYRKPMVQKLPEADFVTVKLVPPADVLDERCYLRFDKMIEAGAVDEVRQLLTMGLDEKLPAMKMLGVPELAGYIRGEYSLDKAVAAAKLHTRQYAKRQRTWFRNKMNALVVFDSIYQN